MTTAAVDFLDYLCFVGVSCDGLKIFKLVDSHFTRKNVTPLASFSFLFPTIQLHTSMYDDISTSFQHTTICSIFFPASLSALSVEMVISAETTFADC
jgi:hypothetical protein